MAHLVKDNNNGTVTISGKCNNSSKIVTVNNISKAGYLAWKDGTPIYEALPNITVDDVNFLMNGVYGGNESQLNYEP